MRRRMPTVDDAVAATKSDATDEARVFDHVVQTGLSGGMPIVTQDGDVISFANGSAFVSGTRIWGAIIPIRGVRINSTGSGTHVPLLTVSAPGERG